jgi:hypothetical protein
MTFTKLDYCQYLLSSQTNFTLTHLADHLPFSTVKRHFCNAMEKAGFKQIVRCDLKQSNEKSLQNLENDSRLPLGSFQLETLTLEGKKLADS